MFNKNKYEELSPYTSTDIPCVSIYIPTHRANQMEKDRITFKNALADVKRNLQMDKVIPGEAMSERAAEGFLTKAYDLLDNQEFWQNQSDGLAVFISKEHFEYFTVPVDFNHLTYVKTHFYLRPMMPLLNGEDRFFILALSQGEIRFFEGHAHHIYPVKIKDLVPANFAEAMAAEDPDKTLQMHGGKDGIHHGHGLHKDQKNWQLEEYCRQVDKGLMEMLHDENAPLIIAAVDELIPIYTDVSTYSNVVDFHISGNPENESPSMLHEKAWAKMKNYFTQNREERKEEFLAAMQDDKASFAVTEVIPRAINGRVEKLYLDKNAPVLWGMFDKSKNKIEIHEEQQPYSVCLYDLAARKTFEQGGEVVHIDRMESPQFTAETSAIFRY